jgi:enoyl-CoA hydratase
MLDNSEQELVAVHRHTAPTRRTIAFSDTVSVEHRGAVAIVRFDRGSALNALRQEDIGALTEAARSFHDDLETRVVVLAGSGRAFSAGADLKDPTHWDNAEKSLLERRHLVYRGGRMTSAWESIPQFTVSAIEGLAIGGGIALALATDLRVIGRSAYLYVPEARVGMNLGWSTVPRLVSLVGPARAKRAILLCEKLPADQAQAWGLVDELVDDGAAESRALEIADQVADLPPHVVRATKEAVNLAAAPLLRAASFMDGDQAALFAADISARGARAAFATRVADKPASGGGGKRERGRP